MHTELCTLLVYRQPDHSDSASWPLLMPAQASMQAPRAASRPRRASPAGRCTPAEQQEANIYQENNKFTGMGQREHN